MKFIVLLLIVTSVLMMFAVTTEASPQVNHKIERAKCGQKGKCYDGVNVQCIDCNTG
uniref:U-megalopygitoxin(2)-Mo9 n=1 Tax=Megalopyge opercularis TaxID=1113279 RepID=TXU29_MEGOP|nr:venom protein U-MPTX.2-9 [Megalopyge opercularis]